LRHTCAALLIRQGVHPKAIQAHLGHSTITVTMDLYGHLFPDDAERLAEALEAAYRTAVLLRTRTNGVAGDSHAPDIAVDPPATEMAVLSFGGEHMNKKRNGRRS
jgi:integrase-like protein